LLLPINVAGVLRSLHQAARGHRIPFLRTPKIAGRTRVPARYVAALFAIVGVCLFAGLQDVLDGNVVHSTFAFANGALFLWGIGTFIGFRFAWDDLHLGIGDTLRKLRPPPTPERASVLEHASVFE
jgi:cellulose synthase (UDP-forming)